MFLIIIYILSVFLLHDVKSVDISAETWRDMNNEIIKVPEYCKSKHKTCLIKCCPKNNFINYINKSMACIEAQDDEMKKRLSFSDVYVYKADKIGNDSTIIQTKDNLQSSFIFVQNDAFSDLSESSAFSSCKYSVLEDGSMDSGDCSLYMPALSFCIDIIARYKRGTGSRKLFFHVRLIGEESDGRARNAFIKVGLGVSGVLCMLVLLVYASLPKLRTRPGFITMGYLGTFVATCVVKIVSLERIDQGVEEISKCNIALAALQYFFILATFFWLNAMSFDLWRMTTKPLQRSNTYCNRQLTPTEWRKLIYFCIYAWVTPALLTLVVVAVDKYKLYSDPDYQPPFKHCYTDVFQVQMYVHIPIGILIIANIVLFAIAAYTIWAIKGKANTGTESSNINRTESRFYICLKVFIVTGGAWILELVPTEKFGVFIAVNFYNVFAGVAIFYIFVCNKKIIIELCKRFNIFNSFVARQQSSKSKSNSTKFTAVNSQKRDSDEEE